MMPPNPRRVILTAFFALLMLAGLFGPFLGPHFAQAQAPHVLVMDIDGIINPVKQRFIDRAVEQAQEDQTIMVVIQLDTPGGLLSSTRKIVEILLEAPVPVAVYVTPRGARAGSAGTFITAAANFDPSTLRPETVTAGYYRASFAAATPVCSRACRERD